MEICVTIAIIETDTHSLLLLFSGQRVVLVGDQAGVVTHRQAADAA